MKYFGQITDAKDITTKEYVDGKALTAGDGVVIENQEVGLLPKYNDFLVRATFETPVLSLSFSGANTNLEIGTEVRISEITHKETHIDNIVAESLKFYRNDAVVQLITPSSSTATATIYPAIRELGTAAKTISYKLECKDLLNDTQISNIAKLTWNRYVYSRVGDPTVVPTSHQNCIKRTNLATFATNGADFTYGIGDCIWLLTTNPNAKIQMNVLGQWVDVTYYNEGSVEFTQENDTTATYYAYRTDAFIAAGTAKYRITNPS